jgi:hypothetical protein
MNEQQGFPTSTRTAQPPRTRPPVYDYDTEDEPRTNTSTRRYIGKATPRTVVRFTTHQEPIRRASRMQYTRTEPQQRAIPVTPIPVTRSRRWLFYAGVILLLMLVGWVLLTVISNWWNGVQDDWHYGRPRTAQYDENVGHGSTSHFIVENLGGHILITEVLPDNPSKAKIYSGPTLAGTDADLAPATLTFTDVNGDKLPDMILTVDNTKYTFLNSKDGFHALNQGGNS